MPEHDLEIAQQAERAIEWHTQQAELTEEPKRSWHREQIAQLQAVLLAADSPELTTPESISPSGGGAEDDA